MKSLKDISWQVSEEEYRADPALSYSTLARFNREGFDNIEHLFDRTESPSLLFGSLVDCLMTGNTEEFNSRFLVADFPELPDSQKKLVEYLWSYYHKAYSSLSDIPDSYIIEATKGMCFQLNWKPETRAKVIKENGGEYYDLLPIIKGLYKHNLLDTENLRVVFHGGDFSVLKEADSVIKTFLKYGVKKIDFSSNNIIFQPIVQKLLAKKKASLNMSLDCGCRETYKLIKRIDKFNDVIRNLKKYVKASKSDNPEINVKYIILKNVNDNENEIKSFIKKMKEIGITRVSLHLEHKYANEIFANKNKIPIHYKNLISLFFELCNENNLWFDTPDEVMHYIMTNQ